jgi:5-methylcytosine-specific restriction endonuclease McrA
MHVYCVERLRFSDGSAYNRIRAARAARRFPRLLRDVAEGRLHLTAICLLAPHLADENADELVAAATHRTRDELEGWIARRFSPAAPAVTPEPRGRIVRIRARCGPVASGAERTLLAVAANAEAEQAETLRADQLLPGGVDLQVSAPEAGVGAVFEPASYLVRLPIDEATHTVLREVQALLGYSVPAGDVVAVFKRALETLRRELLRRKAGRTERPLAETPRRPDARTRTIPAAIRRAVWARDGAQCTFTSVDGRRCSTRRGLEFDHVVAFARGGKSTVGGLRLRCRAHNQFEAERVFGEEFMKAKRRRASPESGPRKATSAPVARQGG